MSARDRRARSGDADEAPETLAPRTSRILAGVLLVLAAWGAVAPYTDTAVGFDIVTRPTVEFVDHVLPGVVLLALTAWSLVAGRLPLPVLLVAILAAFWMTGTHVPLLLQALRGEAPLPAAVYHSLPGILLFLLCVAAAAVLWNEGEGRRA